MPDSSLVRASMKVAHRISLKNKMYWKRFQVIWQPYPVRNICGTAELRETFSQAELI